jgi:hypothetical protein
MAGMIRAMTAFPIHALPDLDGKVFYFEVKESFAPALLASCTLFHDPIVPVIPVFLEYRPRKRNGDGKP